MFRLNHRPSRCENLRAKTHSEYVALFRTPHYHHCILHTDHHFEPKNLIEKELTNSVVKRVLERTPKNYVEPFTPSTAQSELPEHTPSPAQSPRRRRYDQKSELECAWELSLLDRPRDSSRMRTNKDFPCVRSLP